MVFRGRNVLGYIAHEGTAQTGFGPFEGRDQEIALGQTLLDRIRDKEFHKFGGFFRSAFGHQPAVHTTQRIGGLALAARHSGEVEPADFVVG